MQQSQVCVGNVAITVACRIRVYCFDHQNFATVDTYTDRTNIFITNDIVNSSDQDIVYIDFNAHVGVTVRVVRGYDVCFKRIILSIQLEFGPGTPPGTNRNGNMGIENYVDDLLV